MKLLGLNTLVSELNTLKNEVLVLTDENNELKNRVKHLDDEVNALEEKVDEIEIPDFDPDDFVREDDVNDRIESYINDNDIATQSYCDEEIQSKVDEAIEDADIQGKIDEAIEDIDLSDKETQEMQSEITRQLNIIFKEGVSVKIEYLK